MILQEQCGQPTRMRQGIILAILPTLLSLLVLLKPGESSAATFTWTGTASSDWFTPNNWAPSGVPGSADTVNFTNGTINLTQGITIGGLFNWSGGALSGSPITVANSGQMNISGNVGLQNVLTNSGTVTMTGSAALTFYNNQTSLLGGVYNLPGALWDIQTNANFNCACYGNEFFNNAGVFRKSQASGSSSIQVTLPIPGRCRLWPAPFSSIGEIISGSYDTAAGATINFSSGGFTMGGEPAISGAGLCEFTGGTLTLTESVPPNFVLAGGNLVLIRPLSRVTARLPI